MEEVAVPIIEITQKASNIEAFIVNESRVLTLGAKEYAIIKIYVGIRSNNISIKLDGNYYNAEETAESYIYSVELKNYSNGYNGESDAGVVFLGNIKEENMDEYGYMLGELPTLFQETALLDRIHGFVKGWDIPRMNDGLKLTGWALNSEYFCSILHELRNDMSYRAIVEKIVEVPEHADTRDTEAIKRLATAYLKLLFPNVRNEFDVDKMEFRDYCLMPAMKMRRIIKIQQGMIDSEYKNKDVPCLMVRE